MKRICPAQRRTNHGYEPHAEDDIMISHGSSCPNLSTQNPQISTNGVSAFKWLLPKYEHGTFALCDVDIPLDGSPRNTVARLHPTAESSVATVKLLHVYGISLCVQRQDCPTSKSSDIYLNSMCIICSQNPSSYKQSFSPSRVYKSLIIPSKPIKNSIEHVLETYCKTYFRRIFAAWHPHCFTPLPHIIPHPAAWRCKARRLWQLAPRAACPSQRWNSSPNPVRQQFVTRWLVVNPMT